VTTLTGRVGRIGRDREAGPAPDAPTPTPRHRRAGWLTILVPALAAYVPLLFTHTGMVGADTKTYLYLDPGKLLASAPYVWDSHIGLGTVTHQNIGYLFPMGPFYLVLSALQVVPDWIAQRLWLGTVLFAAAMGTRYLLGTLHRHHGRGPSDAASPELGPLAVVVASLAYMLSPYLLDYSARISVILLPWAALPWLIALCARALRHGGWRYPAWFAFVVLTVGGINATALLLVGLGPLLWILNAVFVDREASVRQAAAAVGRIALLTLVTALWWIGGLWAEGRYGLPVIRYTESYRTVATASSSPELLRGLGYWFFYGSDKLGPWIEPSTMYTQWLWLIALSYLLPILAFVAAALVRWRYKAYFIGLIVVGTLVAVAGHPWDSPSLLGGMFQAFTRSDAGLSLRSTPRAVPLIILGTSVLLGAGVEALGRRVPRLAVPAALLVCLLVAANIPPMWTNQMVAANLERPEQIPDYWRQDAGYLDARGPDTRVLEIPGADFASYRWGNTVDPVLPGIMDRGYVARELFQWGSPQSANLVNALDRRLHEDSLDPQALAPIARLIGAGDVNVRSDLQYERYRVARPRQLWDLIRRAPGLGEPATFGPTDPANRAGPRYTMTDEVELGTPTGLPEPPRVAAFPVTDPRPITRPETAQQPLLVAGDGDGLVDAASVGLVGADQPIFYSGSLARDATTWDRVYGHGADLLVTDTNRRRARRWGALRENTGYTERPGEVSPTFDPTDARLDVFPGATDDSYTVTDQRAVAPGLVGGVATATAYGNPITYTPDDRAAAAFDGDPLTAWRVGALSPVKSQRLDVHLAAPVTTDHVSVLQPISLDRSRWITEVRLTFTAPDGTTSSVDVPLDERSRDESARVDPNAGQVLTFPALAFTALSIEVLDTNVGMIDGKGGLSGVGFAEVRIPGVEIVETVRPPVDLLARAGASSNDHRLSLLFSRLRSNPAEPVRADEERSMRRLVTVPTTRSFLVSGQARVSGVVDVEKPVAGIENNAVDRLLGLPDADHGGVTATADVHLAGSPRQRASAAIDGDPSTFWSASYLDQTGHHLDFRSAAPVTFDHLDMVLVNDGRHSVPTQLRLTVDGVDRGVLDIPATERQPTENGTVAVRVPLPAGVTGSDLRFTIEGYDELRTDDWYADGALVPLPVAIAEIGVPGLRLAPPGPAFDSGCRNDLLEIDGRPVPLKVTGTTADALARRALTVESCEPGGVTLTAGDHVLRTASGADPGLALDIDRLLLSSDRGGAAPTAPNSPPPPGPVPATTGTSFDRVSGTLNVDGSDQPYWAVLGQSWSTGWTASVNGHDLGTPVAVNGYANGWYVDPAVVGTGPVEIQMAWTPQRVVWVFIAVSLLGLLACLILMIRRPRRRREPPEPADDGRPLTPELHLPWPFREGVDGLGGPNAETGLSGPNAETGLSGPNAETGLDDRDDTAAEAIGDGSVAVSVPEPDDAPGLRRPVLAIAVAACGVFALVNLPRAVPVAVPLPAVLLAVVVAAVTFLAVRSRRAGGLLALGGAALLTVAVVYILAFQARRRYAPDFQWITYFPWAHVLGLLAVLLLGGEAVRDLVRRARPRD
jgi:arabinofuranan 3-O-arabinosyltransferase